MEKINSNIVKVTDANFEEIIKGDKPVLIDFYADWCMPCKMLAPFISEIADDFKGKAVICKVNIDENAEITDKFGIKSIPTLIIFKDGEPVDKVVGFANKFRLSEMLERHM
ncbi:MAG: thioredoxin [Clostridiales bacterium]|jgi:thioredoxin 1|nr:thioredoxin [Clostridiales bacterium]